MYVCMYVCMCVCVYVCMCVCVCATLSSYMKVGKNLLNEVPVEKSILADFDQFIMLVNKWKAK